VDLSGGLRLGAGGALNILYQGLATFGSANSGLNDGDPISGPLVGFATRTIDESKPVFQNQAGATAPMTLHGLNGRRWAQVVCTAGLDGLWMFRPGTNGQNPVQFADAFPPLVAGIGTPLTTVSPSVKIEALFRKLNAADTTDCRFFFGFTYVRILQPSRQIVRGGMIGDGTTGYGFGSVNAPDGGAAGANAPGDRDANFVAPAALVAPGTDIWKVGVKLVPPTPTQTGRWGAYLNDVLVATFLTTANFPRGYNNGGGPIDDGYRAIEIGFGHYTDGVALAGPLISDPMVTVAFDWSL
jgi:hypothetical protein